MRIRDALEEGGTFTIQCNTGCTPIRFKAESCTESEMALLDCLLPLCISFVRSANADSALGSMTADLLAQLRLNIATLDSGILSYGLVRSLSGRLEQAIAELHVEILAEIAGMISNNATAFHADERLSFEDVLAVPLSQWSESAAPLILGLIDLARGSAKKLSWEEALWDAMGPNAVESILGAVQPCLD